MRKELAAFLAHAAVDTLGFSVLREEIHCVDPIVGGGITYCKPCRVEHYNSLTKTCSENYFASEGDGYTDYCDVTRQGSMGCACDAKDGVLPLDITDGYIPASDAFFARGAIKTFWNYDYRGASLSITGDANYLCKDPDLASTNPQIAWGVGIYKWMETMVFGTTGSTAHKQALKGNFGGTLKVLYGALECPTNTWNPPVHVDNVHNRVAQLCKSGNALGVYMDINKCDTPSDCLECEGLTEIYAACLEDGSCPDCSEWAQFLESVAPTVTPIRVESPDDWDYQPRKSSAVDIRMQPAVFLACLMLFSAGSLTATK